MKKALLLLACTFIAFSINAQVNFGVKAGVNLTTLMGDDSKMENISPGYKVGFAGGGLVNYKLSDALSLQGEVLYSLEGATYKAEGEKLKYNLSYINVPILAQYNHTSGFYAETGPQIGFLTTAKMSYDGNSTDIKEGHASVNFGWGLGAGYKLSNGLAIGARYNLGISSLDKEGDAKVRTGGFHIGISYTFGTGE